MVFVILFSILKTKLLLLRINRYINLNCQHFYSYTFGQQLFIQMKYYNGTYAIQKLNASDENVTHSYIPLWDFWKYFSNHLQIPKPHLKCSAHYKCYRKQKCLWTQITEANKRNGSLLSTLALFSKSFLLLNIQTDIWPL